MATEQDRCERWIENAMGWNDKVLGIPNSANVFYRGDSIFSYGSHFEMGRVLRSSNGDPRAIWLNGDNYSVTTTRHQGMARVAARRACLPTFIVPGSALQAAGLSIGTLEPIHIREDRTETFQHSAESVAGDHVLMDDPNGATEPQRVYAGRLSADADEDGFKTIQRPVRVPDPDRKLVRKNSNWPIAELGEDGLWHWETSRHWLGDSLFFARGRDGRRHRFLSSFDYQESRPLYFLCELPRSSTAETVEQAYEDLRPDEVKAADEAGIEVTRQGDIFAIPTELTTREAKALTPYGKGSIVKKPQRGLLGTRHTASQVLFATGGRIYARGTLYHAVGTWERSDHSRRRMGDGKTWHLLVRNTVPRQQARERSRV
jgi:hypothetical protein